MTSFVERRHDAPVSRSLRVAITVFVTSRIVFLPIAYAAVVMASRMGPVIQDVGRPQLFYDALTGWDGRWYLKAATVGYGEAGVNPATGESTRPFFPLLPALIKLGVSAGLDSRVAGLAATNLAFLAALYFSHRLFDLWRGERFATSATWITGVGPFSAVFSMIYADGLLLLGAVAAVYYFERRRPWAAGAWAAVAAMARPNGVAVAAVLAVSAMTVVYRSNDRLGRAIRWAPVPALPASALAAWMALLGRWAGDPLAFAAAKRAWTEVSIVNGLSPGGGVPPLGGGVVLHLTLALAALGILLWAGRGIPGMWTWVWILYVVPALFLGLIGSGRYAWTIFPALAATALVVRRSRLAKPVVYGLGASATLVTVGIFLGRLVP